MTKDIMIMLTLIMAAPMIGRTGAILFSIGRGSSDYTPSIPLSMTGLGLMVLAIGMIYRVLAIAFCG